MRLILEQRFLFDASLVPVAKTVADSHAPSATTNDASPDAAASHAADIIAALHPVATPTDKASHTETQDNNHAAHEILFIDSRVAGWQTLVANVKSGVQVVVLDPSKDGIEQASQALAGQSGITALHFVTYGQSGEISLGNTLVSDGTLTAKATEIGGWGEHLAAGADIMLWGCEVGQGAEGQLFVLDLHRLTGADIAASEDATGSTALGGDWSLENSTGNINTLLPFSEGGIADYNYVLDTPLPTVTFTHVPSDVLLGDTFSEHITFSNAASTGIGYGPFVDVFVASNADQSATMTSASFLGQALNVTEVTLSTTVTGHTGTLGALHPLAVDAAGNPLFVEAPSGYQDGDTLYVVELPFGSYTPGQPDVDIVLNFETDNISELSASHGNQPFIITAIGGFRYGTDALDNPTTDPSIRGTGSNVSVTDAAEGAVTASSQISLIDVTATTDLNEGETVTGPDYPFHYLISLIPAPVTQDSPIADMDFTFYLPDTVQYTGDTIEITGPGRLHGTATFNPGVAAQGGTVTVHFTSLTVDDSGLPTVLSIPVFIPQTDAAGTDILDASTGASQTLTVSPAFSYTGTWNPVAGSQDFSPLPQTFSGDNTTNPITTDIVAKSMAIQIIDDASRIVPGQIVTYTINFQVSDYFSLDNLNITALIGDGLTLLPPGDIDYAAPTLDIINAGTMTFGISFNDPDNPQSYSFTAPIGSAVDNQTVAESGSNDYWNYSRDNGGITATPGTTSINFAVGALLANQFGPGAVASVLEGSNGAGVTQGTITFKAKVLDWYTNNNNQQSLRERDSVSASVQASSSSADVVTVSSGTVTPTGSTVSDGSESIDSVANGNVALSIVAVNGVAVFDVTAIQPGDDITYALTYSLTTGDYADLNLTSHLPLPLFEATDPLADGSSITSYTENTTDTYPGAGQYRLVTSPSGSTIYSANADATGNSIAFDLGTHDSTDNNASQIVIYYTVKASNEAYASELSLSNMASSLYTNATGTSTSIDAIAATEAEPVVYQEPNNGDPQDTQVAVIPDIIIGSGMYSGATVAVTGNFQLNEDVLFPTANVNTNIIDSYDPATGVMTLSGLDTAEHYQQVLRSVLYYDEKFDDLTTSPRTITISLTKDGVTEQVDVVDVHVVANNDSPVTGVINPETQIEIIRGSGAPNGAVGALIEQYLSITLDTDSDTLGIAITSAETTFTQGPDTINGIWYYSLDNGANWQVMSIPSGDALALVADGNTRIYFQSLSNDFQGTLTNAMTFRFWDTENGVAHGSVVTMPDMPGTDFSSTGPEALDRSSYSEVEVMMSIQVDVPLSIVGQSNDTTDTPPTQTDTLLAVDAVVGEIVRLHAYIRLPIGENPTTLDFTLPSNLGYLDDGNATIALIGSFSSDNPDIDGISRYQSDNNRAPRFINPSTTPGSPNNIATLAPTDLLPAGVVDTSVANHVTFDFGILTNSHLSDTYIIIEFNAVVKNVDANQDGSTTSASFTLNSAGSVLTSNSTTITVKEPAVSITKEITNIDTVTSTITYQMTLTNNGSATAYNITFDDQADNNEQNVTYLSDTGSGNVTNNTTSTALQGIIDSLAPGDSKVILYTVQVIDPTIAVNGDLARVTWESLPDPTDFHGSSVGADDTDTGERDYNSANPSLNDYTNTDSVTLPSVSGRIWRDLGSNFASYDAATDTGLSGLTVTAESAGLDGIEGTSDDITYLATTDADGNYSFGLLPIGHLRIHLNANGDPGGPATNETLIFNPYQNGQPSDPASASVLNDGSTINGVNFVFQAPDTSPVVNNWGGVNPQIYVEGSLRVLLSNTGATLVSDAQLDALIAGNDPTVTDYRDTVLTVQRYENGTAAPDASDEFSGDGSGSVGLVLANGDVTFDGVLLGTYAQAGGILDITFGAGAQKGDVQNVLNHLTYKNNGSNLTASTITIGATFYDGNETGGNNYQGSPDPLNNTSLPTYATIDLVAASNPDSTYSEPNNGPAIDNIVEVSPGLIVSSGSYSNANISISSNFQTEADILTVDTTGTNILASYDDTTGILSLTGTDSAENYQQVLRSLQYYNSSDTPITLQRSITIDLVQNTVTIQSVTATINVVKNNDSPVLVASPVTMDNFEDAPVPTGAVGMLVSTVIVGMITDADDNTGGIAITEARTSFTVGSDTVNGTWYYSIDNGANWTEINIPTDYVLDLVADSNTRIYFQPLTANFNGDLTQALTFRAWDGANGVANGALVEAPSSPGTDLSSLDAIGADNSAYSSATAELSVRISVENDSPVLAAAPIILGSQEDGVAPVGAVGTLVQTLVSGMITDIDGPISGIAITEALTSFTVDSQAVTGTWFYSIDNGDNWTEINIPTGQVLDLMADNDTRIYFQPLTADFNGDLEQGLTFRAWDGTNGVANGTLVAMPVAPGTGFSSTGAVDADNSSYSAETAELTVRVAAVNDAPVLTSSPIILDSQEDNTVPTGAVGTLVQTLVSGMITDIDGPTNGIAITEALTSFTVGSQTVTGTWFYSIDDGANWTVMNIPTGQVLDLVADSNTRIYFQPLTADFNGDLTQALTFRAWDTANGVANGELATMPDDPGAAGLDNSSYSAETADLTVRVAAVNDAPVLTSSPIILDSLEDGALPTGAVGTLVQTLVSGIITDVDGPLNGIAITEARTSFTVDSQTVTGTWYYSIDNGANWTVMNISTGQALDLLVNNSTRIYFRPLTADFNGDLAQALTFRAWDGMDNVSNGALATMPVAPGTEGTDNSSYSSATAELTVRVAAVNDAPVLTSAPIILDSQEDAALPTGAVGTLVQTLVSGMITDIDGPLNGIAITEARTSFTVDSQTVTGTWYYSIDNGANWAVMNIPTGQALDLLVNNSTRIYFRPLTADFNGDLAQALTFRAWDGMDNVSNGALATIPVLPDSEVIGIPAYSSATADLTVRVAAVNDTPVLTSAPIILDGQEDSAVPSGAVGTLVQTLVSGMITDIDTPTNGIAITEALTSFTVGSQTVTGTWFYSIDDGANWTVMNIPTGQVLDLVADSNTRIYFQPLTANFNGDLAQALTFRAWDTTNGVANGSLATMPVAPGTAGDDNSAYSVVTASISLQVAAVNDAPVASGNIMLGKVNLGEANTLTGHKISDILASHFSDNADQQQTVTNVSGSNANDFAGVAIIGNDATSVQGVWQYSTDGVHWNALPSVSDSDALILPASAELRFVPAGGFAGMPGSLYVRLIENSDGAITVAAGVNVSNHGGLTAISDNRVEISVIAEIPESVDTPSQVPPVLTPSVVMFSHYTNRTPGFHTGFQSMVPQIWVIGSAGSHFVIADHHAIIPIPSGIFQNSDPTLPLTIEARMPGGAPLPSWLNFDPRAMVFSGTPPMNVFGTINVILVARDPFGNETIAEFRIKVGQRQEDLLAIISSLSDTDEGGEENEEENPEQPATKEISHKNRPELHGKHSIAELQPHADFSSQLHNAGQEGRIAKAQALLKVIAPQTILAERKING
jgi:hypothetical protein